jgi:Zn-dependent protease
MFNIAHYLIIAPPILLALTIHEFAHGWVAYRLGDPTAKEMGRLTLNPLAHLDPIGTLMLFIARIGWAKPVPINPYYFRNPKRDLLWVSLAGPGANLLGALFFGLILRSVDISGLWLRETGFFDILKIMVIYCVLINLVLAFFNLIPVPPLDGSKILMSLLPPEQELKYREFERYGPLALMGVILFGFLFHVPILWYIIGPFVKLFSILFAGIDLSGL